MADFLSAAWFASVGGPEADLGEAELVIHQVVTGGPAGDIEYGVAIRGDAVSVVAGAPAAADIRLEQDYATAAAIHAGELPVDDALAAGRVRVTGDTSRLVAAGPSLAAATAAAAAMRDALTRA